jgi:hypothetical protein
MFCGPAGAKRWFRCREFQPWRQNFGPLSDRPATCSGNINQRIQDIDGFLIRQREKL